MISGSTSSNSYVVVGRLSQPITCNSSLNVSGVTTLSNNTSINGTLNVMGSSTFQSSLNVSGAFTCNALSALSATLPSILFTTSTTTINNPNTTIPSILMISGNTSFNSGINITGRTIIGDNIYNYSDSVFELYKNFTLRKNVTNVGDAIELKCGLGTVSSYLSMQQGYDINLTSLTGNVNINSATTSAINLTAPTVYISNNLNIQGALKCSNQGQRIPLYFTTNRNINLNGTTFSCYDIDLRLYTNSLLLDGYNIRQF